MNIPRALLATGLTLFAWVPALAQTQQPSRPERPYRGIFASGMDDSGQSLTANASLSGGYDDNVLAQATNSNSNQEGQAGTFGQFSGGLNYSLNASRGSLNATAGTSQRYYPSLQNDLLENYNASIGGSLLVTTKPAITVFQSAGYQPYTFLSAFPMATEPIIGASEITDPDVVPLAEQYLFYNGGVTLSHRLSQRTTFESGWNYRATDQQSNQWWQQTADAGFSIGLNRDLSLRLGYAYTEAHYEDRLTKVHRPQIGLDFLRALSLTRRTTLAFGMGTEATVQNDTTKLNASGNATLRHEMGRSWTAAAAYQRGTYFVDTFQEPIMGDSWSLNLGGLITRRLQLQAVASGSLGRLTYTSRNFDSYRGTVTLSTALTRFMNVGVDYAYYSYEFDDPAGLEPGVSQDVIRQSIRARVSFWAPLFNKSRRANAAR